MQKKKQNQNLAPVTLVLLDHFKNTSKNIALWNLHLKTLYLLKQKCAAFWSLLVWLGFFKHCFFIEKSIASYCIYQSHKEASEKPVFRTLYQIKTLQNSLGRMSDYFMEQVRWVQFLVRALNFKLSSKSEWLEFLRKTSSQDKLMEIIHFFVFFWVKKTPMITF